jgi:hypothetical protein
MQTAAIYRLARDPTARGNVVLQLRQDQAWPALVAADEAELAGMLFSGDTTTTCCLGGIPNRPNDRKSWSCLIPNCPSFNAYPALCQKGDSYQRNHSATRQKKQQRKSMTSRTHAPLLRPGDASEAEFRWAWNKNVQIDHQEAPTGELLRIQRGFSTDHLKEGQ